jgi:predicted RNase H-like HicB family nuclease
VGAFGVAKLAAGRQDVIAKSGLVSLQTRATQPGADLQRLRGFAKRDLDTILSRFGTTAPDEMGSMKRKKSGQQALVAYLCRFRPEPEGGFTVSCPKLPPVVTYGETLEEAQANAREAIELCLEVMREDGHPIPPPDRDLSSPIDQLVPVAAADA